MPVVESQIQFPIITKSLTREVYTDSHDFDISEETYDEIVSPIFKELVSKGVNPANVEFDPSKHLLFTDDYYNKTTRLTLDDLQINQAKLHQEPISQIGVSEPFPLFTEEAIDLMRYELFAKENFLKNGRINEHSNTGDLDMYSRGSYQPFTTQAWKHPKVLEIISKMSGVDLVHQIDYEIGHSNVTIKSQSTKLQQNQQDIEEEDVNDIQATVNWHYDSPQFVCVLMMSDTSEMIGGETALLMGNGKVAKVAGPRKGWANVLQGRLLKHIASKPKGDFKERITAVASLRPKDPMLDNCFNTTTKPSQLKGSRYNEFYRDWMNYRYQVLIDRIQAIKKEMNDSFERGEIFDQLKTIDILNEKIIDYVEHTYQEFEVVDDGLVAKPKSYNAIKARFEEL